MTTIKKGRREHSIPAILYFIQPPQLPFTSFSFPFLFSFFSPTYSVLFPPLAIPLPPSLLAPAAEVPASRPAARGSSTARKAAMTSGTPWLLEGRLATDPWLLELGDEERSRWQSYQAQLAAAPAWPAEEISHVLGVKLFDRGPRLCSVDI
jgi:hypothetical protein